MSIANRLALIEERIARACRRTSRPREEVLLVGASKQQPLSSLVAAYDGGLRQFGENRVQEARDKRSELPHDIEWHLLGPLQSNKVAVAVQLFTTFHAIDRPKIALAVARAAHLEGLQCEGFLEVNLGAEPSKHGVSDGEVVETLVSLRAEIQGKGLDLAGLMAIPPQEDSAEATRGWFRRLRELRDACRYADPSFQGRLSMGMSSDFELAIEEGATHIRVGTELFGPRSPREPEAIC
ncbi:MAG: YggS family pyridoxal phosphate-dependent enzyme [Thermoanaerobaculia bacterium]|nr:YggS family pyridoxal phosphate-dependent enzyme [Thermoanaerobaculia bacterium]